MNSPIRLLASSSRPSLAFVAPLRATTYTYTGSANTTINGVTESVFTQTYTLSGTIIAPAQIKIVSTYNGGSTQVETYVFTTTGYKVTHNLLDPSTGAVVSSAQGTWTLQYGSQKNVIQAVAIQLKFKGSPAATATLDIGQEPVPANGGPVTVNGTPFTTSFTVKSGGATTVTTFSGRRNLGGLHPALDHHPARRRRRHGKRNRPFHRRRHQSLRKNNQPSSRA